MGRKERNEEKRKKKNKIIRRVLYVTVPLFVIFAIISGVFFYINGKIYVPTPKDFFQSDAEKMAAKYDEEQGLINILLVGLDGRVKDEDSRTDSIILATIDTNNKRVKLTSFMRDMYVPIPGHKDGRINSAFTMGGPELLIKTINNDFGLNIQYYASIDFRAFQDLVEKLGGVEVEVKDHEVKEINKYIKEVNGSKATLIQGPGYQSLNGQQALSYCRIRKVGNNDYERTERQRRVLSLLIKKARKTSMVKLPDLLSTVLPYIKTNIPTTKLMNLGYTVYKFGNTPVDNMRIPNDGTFEGMVVYGMDVLVPDLQRNADMLDRFIFLGGGATASNMPAYMVNNFHTNDKAVDKRGQKKPIPVIVIPEEAKQVPQLPEENSDVIQDGNTGGVIDSGNTQQNGQDQNTGQIDNGQNGNTQQGDTSGQSNNNNNGDNSNNQGQTTNGNPGQDNNSGNNSGTGNTSGSNPSGEIVPPPDGTGGNTTTP